MFRRWIVDAIYDSHNMPGEAKAKMQEDNSSTWVELPEVEDLLNPTLRVMRALGGTANNEEIAARVILDEGITHEQLAIGVREDGKGTVARRLGIARTWLKDYGLLENVSSGKWRLIEGSIETATVEPADVKRAHDIARRKRQESRKVKSDEARTRDAVPASILLHLEAIIQQRKSVPPADSYTSSLFAAGSNRIAQKVGEESSEVIVAALGQGRTEQTGELADLVYHLLVLMAQLDITLDDVCAELERRHQPR